jgi:hypothetical protein
MRLLVALALSAAASAPLRAQRLVAPTLPIGTPLRVVTPTRAVTGTLVALLGDTLVMQTRTERSILGDDPSDLFDQLRLPRDSIVQVFVQSGREPRLRSTLRDGAWGALLGAGFTSASFVILGGAGNGAFSNPSGRRDLMLSTILLLGIGAAYGNGHPQAQWSELPMDGSRSR